MDRLTANTGENETAETKASYDAYGKPLSMTDAQGNTTKFEYDRHDNLVCVTRADGGEVKYTYYENGLLQSQTDACGNTTVYTYDASGRIETDTDGEENTVSLTQGDMLCRPRRQLIKIGIIFIIGLCLQYLALCYQLMEWRRIAIHQT